MEINQNILTTSNLTFDINPSLSETKDIHFGLNLDFGSYSNSEFLYYIQNVASNELCVDFGKEILGVIKLNDDNYTVFIEDEILLFDARNCTKVSLVIDSCLNFGTRVKGVYKYNREGRTVYFIDEKNSLRYFNIDKPYPKKKVQSDCNSCKDEYTLRLDCDKLLVWKNIDYPKLRFRKGNGRLPSGKYQIAIAFSSDKLRLTDYFIYPNIFTISPYEKSSLNLEFECFNNNFEEYELVLISHREDRGTVAQRISFFDTAQTSYSINEVDSPSYTPIDTKILFANKPYYQGFEHIAVNGTTTEGQLVLGGLKERKPINYWNEAFNIVGKWVEVRVPEKEAYKLPSFMRDEVYSLEIGWIYSDGQISNRTHIPSIVNLEPLWNTIPNNDDTWTDCNNIERKYWEIYNTAKSTGCQIVTKTKQVEVCDYTVNVYTGTINVVYTSVIGGVETVQDNVTSVSFSVRAVKGKCNVYGYWEDASFDISEGSCTFETISYQENQCTEQEYTDDIELCEFKVTNQGNFAYWESQLTYPDHLNFNTDRGDFRCKGYRHWKFPDNKLSNHHVTVNGKEYANLLTIQLSNIEKPKDCDGNYIEDIIGYVIYVTDRANHKSVLHKGMISNMWKEDLADCSTSYYNNYPFNDLNPDVFLSKTLTHGDVRNSYKPVTDYARDRFTYISPDVDYIRNSTGEELILYSEENGFVKGSYNSTSEFPEIKYLSNDFYRTLGLLTLSTYALQIALSANALGTGLAGGGGTSSIPILIDSYYSLLKGFLPYDNYGINYYSHATYTSTNFKNIKEGNIRRKLNYSNYLLTSKQIQDGDKVNNYHREQGLYLKLNRDIQDPFNKEYSRVRTKDAGCNDFDTKYVFNPATGDNQRATCSSYYSGIKVYKPTQYGNLNNSVAISKYFTTDIKNINTTDLIFGGDIYITKHKKLRKFPFFTVLPPNGYNDLGILQSKTFNIWKPRFYMDYKLRNPIFGAISGLSGIDGIANLIDKSPFNFEYGNGKDKINCTDQIKCIRPSTGDGDELVLNARTFRYDGSIYTHVIGIQEYWCESEFVSDYREINDIPESNLNVDETSLIKYKRVENPELSLYNLQYLWNGVISNSLSANQKVSCCCNFNTDQSRIIFSQAANIESQGDKWLSYSPLNYHQFTNTYGKMIGLHKVNDGNMMFIFEDATFVSQNNTGILTDKGVAYLGEGSIFQRNMVKLPGSSDYLSFVDTPYGVYWCNKKLKEFYFFDSRLNNITDGIRSWSYEFISDTEEIKGIYDPYTENVYWSSDKWTISFKPKAKTWVSFHSFLPKYYLDISNNFLTTQTSSIWKHNSKYDYQNYYGVQYPFIVGFTINNKFELRHLHSLEVYADFIKEYGFNSKEYTDDFFTKIAVFSNKTSTGLQEIYKNDLDIKDKPKFTRLNEGKYRINGFKNVASGQPLTEFTNMSYKFLNTNNNFEGNIIGYTHKVHLQNDKNIKLLLKLNLSVEQTNIK